MTTSELICLRCKTPLDPQADACPQCSEKVTQFQRTYSTRLLDGKYQILDRLGVGGMGEIFKVRHIHLGEQRVVKIMRANIATDDQALQRFLYEARLATTVKHRNLAMLYDFSTLDDGSYYMVWEFIDGVNIQKWISTNGPVPPRIALEVAIQALSGLEALHHMGIIHRDISPENIMLSQDHRGALLVKVIDFGIAKQLSESEGGHGLTQTGMFLGKLKYASPEQAGFIREGEHLDARSDLYSFGIVLYEMLAGKAPFLATNPQGYILKHATEKPPSIRQTNPATSVPPELERVVLKALEKDRANRHADTAEFISELEALRPVIPADEKWGLGAKMITLTATPTIVDTKSFTSPTMGTRPAPTVVDRGAEATVIEGAAGAAATVVESKAGAAATVVERKGGFADAAPTVVERKGGFAEAAPTVLERKAAPEAKKKPVVWIASAAAAVLVLTVGGLMLKRGGETTPDTTTATVAAMTTTTPASINTSTMPDDMSVLLLTGGPWVELSSIENLDRKQAVPLAELDNHFPLRLPLEPGTYRVTMSDAKGNPVTREVRLEPKKTATLHSSDLPGNVNLEQVVDDILKK